MALIQAIAPGGRFGATVPNADLETDRDDELVAERLVCAVVTIRDEP